MTQPTQYNRQYNFTDYQSANPDEPLPAPQVDAEYNAIRVTLSQTLANLALIQRDDGKLANQSVSKDTLDASALALIGLKGFTVRGDWAAAVAYNAGDLVDFNDATYVAIVSHTSGAVFDTDLAASKWLLIANAALLNNASAVDVFIGNGSQTVFNTTYSYSGNTAAKVYVNGLLMRPTTDYSISGTVVTFVNAPPAPATAGQNNIVVWGSTVEVQAAVQAGLASASNSAGSAAAALASQNAASISQAAALASQNAAASSQTAAAGSASSAATSATNSATSATSSAASAATATTKATEASNSAAAALTSQNAAAASQSAAATSATNSANSASAASTSATAAASSASNASSSAISSANSATNAATSATNSASSASSASASAASAANSAQSAAAAADAATTSTQIPTQEHVATAGQTDFALPYPIGSAGGLLVTVNRVDQIPVTSYIIPNPDTLRFTAPLTAGDSIAYRYLDKESQVGAAAAQEWATKTTGFVTGTTEYSAKKHAQDAAISASAALLSEQSADTSEAAALSSKNAAASSEASALLSKNAAASSETNALASKNAAQAAQGASETARDASQLAKTASEAARDTANAHKNDAQSAKTLAESARDTANAKASEASASASAAATSATNAASSATASQTARVGSEDARDLSLQYRNEAQAAAASASGGNTAPQTFTGNGTTTDFNLVTASASVHKLIVSVANVLQDSLVAYSLINSGATLRFAAAPANGVRIVVRYV